MEKSATIGLAIVVVVVIAIAAIWMGGNRTTTVEVDEPIVTTAPLEEVATSSPLAVSPTPLGTLGVSPSPTTATTIGGEVKTFTVTGSPFKFSMAEMRVKQGDRVKIIFQNESGMHDFKIDEFNVATKVLQAGQSETIEFVPDKKGSFEYYCSVATHRQMGMKGTLIVE